jgi:hypothetical protein
MPIKDVHSSFDYVTLSNMKNDLIDASVSIELPLNETEELNYQNCIVVYFDYDISNPYSKRTYKLFKHFYKTTKESIENEFKGLGKLQGLYIINNITEDKSVDLINRMTKRHILL